MPDHVGRRGRRSRLPLARLAVLAVALVGVVRLLTLPAPAATSGPAATALTPAPVWAGPKSVDLPAQLSDGSAYEPRLYLTLTISIGVALTPDQRYRRVLLRESGRPVVELRRVSTADHPEFDGFTAAGDTVIWAESISPANGGTFQTSLWRANWRSGQRSSVITYDGGAANFLGGRYDLVVNNARVYWAALGELATAETEIRSVGLGGGKVTIRRFTGAYALSAWPWLVSVTGGRGAPVALVNLDSGKRMTVTTGASELASCSPSWCRIDVLGESALARIDVQRPDGSQRQRVAGSEATPTITDVALLDRYIPLKTDFGEANAALSLYDISTQRTDLVATNVANIHGLDSIVWWSTGVAEEMVWHAIDLRALS